VVGLIIIKTVQQIYYYEEQTALTQFQSDKKKTWHTVLNILKKVFEEHNLTEQFNVRCSPLTVHSES
jgi:hypothetical protein